MKKLNRKGFTLIELLAVIVVLAIVLVVTIPSVLTSMQTARNKQFNNAISAIEKYVQGEIDKCALGDTSLTTYNTNIIESTCQPKSSAGTTILSAAGYSTSDISITTYDMQGPGNTFAITGATAVSGGKFDKAPAINISRSAS